MIKIELLPEVDETAELGFSNREYMWLNGNPWPIDPAEDFKIGKLEAFGLELDLVASMGGEATGIDKAVYRCWYRDEAAYMSKYLRKNYGTEARIG